MFNPISNLSFVLVISTMSVFGSPVALSFLNSLIKSCLSALPGYAQINVSYNDMISSQLSLLSPSFEVEYNSTYTNLAYVTAEVLADFFDINKLHGLTIVGTSKIVAEGGWEADAEFLAHYIWNTLLLPNKNLDQFLISDIMMPMILTH